MKGFRRFFACDDSIGGPKTRPRRRRLFHPERGSSGPSSSFIEQQNERQSARAPGFFFIEQGPIDPGDRRRKPILRSLPPERESLVPLSTDENHAAVEDDANWWTRNVN